MSPSPLHLPHRSRRRSAIRPLGAVLSAGLLVASCASSAAAPNTSPGDTQPVSSSGPPVETPVTTVNTTATSNTTPSGSAAPPPSALPAIVRPMALTGSPLERAATLAGSLADETVDRGPAVLAAFEGAGLPVVLADGSSLTSTVDPVGLPWSIVASLTTLSSAQSRVSLAQIIEQFGLLAPTTPYDASGATSELLNGLRAAASGSASAPIGAPTFVADLVAEEARRTNGAELADPATTADMVYVSLTTALVIEVAALRSIVAEAADTDAWATDDITGGPGRETHGVPRAAPADDNPGCDDGLGGWRLWVASKLAAGATLTPGVFEWKGIYNALATYGIAAGKLSTEALELTSFAGRAAGLSGAFANLVILQQQFAGRHATARMDGDGPLVRTKTTSHGSARTITLEIYDSPDDPKFVNVRNCILAALAVTGNNAQQPLGPAAHMQVDTIGGQGFTQTLAPGNSIVLFGPATFEPVQTTGDDGTITIGVQGRRQRRDLSEVTSTVAKTFSLWFQASLDPIELSQLTRSGADSLLCAGTALGGDAVDAFAECQNAAVDIIKQFHWFVGEFSFPLTDWAANGWWGDTTVGPYRVTTQKCDGAGGTWSLDLSGNLDGAEYNATVTAEIDPGSLDGAYTLSGQAVGGGFTVPVVGSGPIRFVDDGPRAAHLEVSGIQGTRGAAGSTDGVETIPLTPSDCQ